MKCIETHQTHINAEIEHCFLCVFRHSIQHMFLNHPAEEIIQILVDIIIGRNQKTFCILIKDNFHFEIFFFCDFFQILSFVFFAEFCLE